MTVFTRVHLVSENPTVTVRRDDTHEYLVISSGTTDITISGPATSAVRSRTQSHRPTPSCSGRTSSKPSKQSTTEVRHETAPTTSRVA